MSSVSLAFVASGGILCGESFPVRTDPAMHHILQVSLHLPAT